jgi:hypothetical protein
MKKLMVITFCMVLVLGVSAQTHSISGYHGSVAYIVQPRMSVGIGFAPYYSPFGYYGFPYGIPYGGYYPYGPTSRPTTLQRKEDEIRSDYEDKIYSVHHDDSLTAKEKRQTIRELKKQRKKEIHDLVANYHKEPVTK